MNARRTVWLCLGLLLYGVTFAGEVQVQNAWARATLPGQDTGMVSLVLTSKHAATLVRISTPVCKAVELHQMKHADGMMTMRQVETIALPAGKHLNFEDAGYHLMLIGLKRPLEAGEKIPLTLTIRFDRQRTSEISAIAEVESLHGRPDMDAADMHHH